MVECDVGKSETEGGLSLIWEGGIGGKLRL